MKELLSARRESGGGLYDISLVHGKAVFNERAGVIIDGRKGGREIHGLCFVVITECKEVSVWRKPITQETKNTAWRDGN
jgi:hypothetical protein